MFHHSFQFYSLELANDREWFRAELFIVFTMSNEYFYLLLPPQKINELSILFN